jgi:hypothetical protein
MASAKPRRPVLNRRIIEALSHVEWDAYYACEERAGNDAALPKDDLEWQGIEYLRALIAWYDATHPAKEPKSRP